MPHRPYRQLVIPLGRGLDQARPRNPAESEPTLREAVNVDFGLRGALSGRPGAVRTTGFALRSLSAAGDVSTSDVASLEATGYATPSLFAMRDGAGERPGLLTRGRVFTLEGDRWIDRLGCTAARSRRLCELRDVGDAGFSDPLGESVKGAAPDFAVGHSTTGGADTQIALLADNGTIEGYGTSTVDVGLGNGVRCGQYTAYVFIALGGSSTVRMLVRDNGTRDTEEYDLASDAAPIATFNQGAPVACCDFDQDRVFVAYWKDTGEIVVLKVDVRDGSVDGTYTSASTFQNPRGIWVTNSSVAENAIAVIAGYGLSGITSAVHTQVIDADTMTVRHALDVGSGGASLSNSGQVVCGVAENDAVWLAWVDDDGDLHIGARALTTNTEIFERTWRGATPADPSDANVAGPVWYLQHQFVKVDGRVLLGVSTAHAAGISFRNIGATWLVCDVTDLWQDETGQGKLRDPVAVAKGEASRSMAPWRPMAAIVNTDGVSYRFPTVDWQDIRFVAGTPPGLIGTRGSLGLNEVTLTKPQVAHFFDSTIIAGSVPRMVARGHAHPVGFPCGEYPTLQTEVIATAGSSWSVGSYTLQAIWTWVDEAGQTHYSEPSFPVTVDIDADFRQLAVEISVPHFNERETGTVYCELYAAGPDPASNEPLRLVERFEYPGTGAATVSQTYTNGANFVAAYGKAIYTGGGVLESQVPDASGGVATVGSRCWVSDGRSLYASRLGTQGEREAPSWHIDGTLTIDVPPVAGRVVGLGSLDDKLVVFCERGIYGTGGEGPDDLGLGPAFIPLQKVSDLGLASQRSLASTPRGIVFECANTSADSRPGTGGLWLLDRGLNTNQVSLRAQEIYGSFADGGDVAFAPEREQVYWWIGSDILVWDWRMDAWFLWTVADPPSTGCVIGGVLWACGSEPMQFTGTGGQDSLGSTVDVTQSVNLDGINVGPGGIQWGRVRSLTVVGDSGASHELSMAVKFDDEIDFAADPVTVPAGATGTWPTNKYAPEWRLPQRKTGSIAISLSATPAVAVWTAVVLEVFNLGGKAPARQRQ